MLELLKRFIPSPVVLLMNLAGLSLAAGAAWWAWSSHLDHQQQIGYDRAQGEIRKATQQKEREDREKEQGWSRKLEEARNDATKREQDLASAAAASAAAAGQLRGTVAHLRQQLAGATTKACRTTADAALAVFDSCAERYREVAAAADGHASDVKTLTAAWPE